MTFNTRGGFDLTRADRQQTLRAAPAPPQRGGRVVTPAVPEPGAGVGEPGEGLSRQGSGPDTVPPADGVGARAGTVSRATEGESSAAAPIGSRRVGGKVQIQCEMDAGLAKRVRTRSTRDGVPHGEVLVQALARFGQDAVEHFQTVTAPEVIGSSAFQTELTPTLRRHLVRPDRLSFRLSPTNATALADLLAEAGMHAQLSAFCEWVLLQHLPAGRGRR